MDSFTFDAGTSTVTFSVACALRMRVSMSAMGSLMLIFVLLPARLDHSGNLAAHRDLADLVAPEPELAEGSARASGDRAAIAQAHGRGVARQRLQFRAGLVAGVVGCLGILDHREQRLALLREPLHGSAALRLAIDDGKLGHYVVLSVLNGNRNAARRAFASSSVFAVVVMEMFKPRSASTLS